MADYILQATISNMLVTAVLAFFAWVVQRNVHSASLANLLWAVVLLKLVTPPIVSVPVVAVPTLAEVSARSPEHQENERIKLGPPVDPVDSSREKLGLNDHDPLASSDTSGTQSASDYIPMILGAGWLLSSIILLIVSSARILRFHILLKKSSQVDNRVSGPIAHDLAARLGLRKVPTIWTTKAKVAPFVWWLNGSVSVIVPEQTLHELSHADIRLILAHELAHIQRRDHWFRWIEWIAQIVFWWNPLVWMARKHLRISEEMACDEIVLRTCSAQVQQYASSLLNMADILASPSIQPPIVASSLYGGGCLEKRLRMMIGPRTWAISPSVRWGLLASAACFFPIGLVYGQDLEAVEKRLGGAVEAGELTLGQANAMLETLRKSKTPEAKKTLKAYLKPAESYEESKINLDETGKKFWYQVAPAEKERELETAKNAEKKHHYFLRLQELEAAVAAEKLSTEQAEEKKVQLRRYLFRDAPVQEKKAKGVIKKRYQESAEKIKAAVREEKISKEQAAKRLRLLKEGDAIQGVYQWVPAEKADEAVHFEVKEEFIVKPKADQDTPTSFRINLNAVEFDEPIEATSQVTDKEVVEEVARVDLIRDIDDVVTFTADREMILLEDATPEKAFRGTLRKENDSRLNKVALMEWKQAVEVEQKASELDENAKLLKAVKSKVTNDGFRKQLAAILATAHEGEQLEDARVLTELLIVEEKEKAEAEK